MRTLTGFVVLLAIWPLSWVVIAGERLGFATRGVVAVLEGCFRALRAGEVTVLLTLGALLLPGMVLIGRFTVQLVTQLMRTRRLLRELSPKRSPLPERLQLLAQQAGLSERLVFYQDPTLFAFAYGVLSPRVAMSAGMTWVLTDAELLAVLRHEAHHLHRGAVVRHLVREALKASLGFLPTVAAIAKADHLRDELAADRFAGETDPEALVSALLKLARLNSAPSLLPSASSGLEHRVRAICGLAPSKRVPQPQLWMAMALSLIFLTLPLVGHAVEWRGAEVHFQQTLEHVGTTTC